MQLPFTPVTNKASWGSSAFWAEPIIDSKSSGIESNLHRAAALRTISNFVSIVTGEPYPVRYIAGNQSYTDGKEITIGSNVEKPEDFDVTVGLALHEASHIKASDFEIIKSLNSHIARVSGRRLPHLQGKAEIVGTSLEYLVKAMLNWVEDRRLDWLMTQEAPGYVEYYRAMYAKYFNSPVILKALESKHFRDESVESYLMRVINLHSDSTDLSALGGLKSIWSIADLPNIGRIKTTEAALAVAIDMVEVILKHVVSAKSDKKQQGTGNTGSGTGDEDSHCSGTNSTDDNNCTGDDNTATAAKGEANSTGGTNSTNVIDKGDEDEGEGDTGEGEGDTGEGEGDTGEGEGDTGEGEGDTGEGDSNCNTDTDTDADSTTRASTGSGTNDKPGNTSSNKATKAQAKKGRLTPNQVEKALKDLQKQLDFGEGKIKKDRISSVDLKEIKEIVESGTTIVETGKGWRGGKVKTILVNTLTEALLNSSDFPLKTRGRNTKASELTKEAWVKGNQLASKLQVRGEVRETIFNRQKTGKVDKRLISTLGWNNPSVFYTKTVDQYKSANIHLSIDASGSMGGSKWNATLLLAMTLAKAVEKIPNLQMQISFRTTTGYKPYVVCAWDSRRDGWKKIQNQISTLLPAATTPEGLAFEAIETLIPATTPSLDSYFVNISDGEPACDTQWGEYTGMSAAAHTLSRVKAIEAKGVKVLSYFVSEQCINLNTLTAKVFKASYGQAASFIDINNINEISKTLNRLFMTK